MSGAPRDVILAHGLWMPGAVMSLLGARLQARGYAPRVFAYRGRRPLEANVERLARFARATLGASPAHFVGHSLGGLLVLEALNAYPAIAAASVVLLAAPVRGCLAARHLARAGIGRWMLGASAAPWIEEREARWERRAPLGVVAGTLSLGLGRTVGRLPGANDGVVRVEETAVAGMTERVLVPLCHSSLVVSGRVARLVVSFLEHGSFGA